MTWSVTILYFVEWRYFNLILINHLWSFICYQSEDIHWIIFKVYQSNFWNERNFYGNFHEINRFHQNDITKFVGNRDLLLVKRDCTSYMICLVTGQIKGFKAYALSFLLIYKWGLILGFVARLLWSLSYLKRKTNSDISVERN